MSGMKASALGPSACPECGGPRINAEAYSGMQVVVPGTVQSSQLRAVVCVGCGQTTFYAKEPDRLAPRE
jgi:hypothetical protein